MTPPHSKTSSEQTLDYVSVYTTDIYPSSGVDALDPTRSEDFVGGDLTRVLGVTVGGVAKAYPLPEGVVNDTVVGRPVVVTVASGYSLVAYYRTVDGSPRRFVEVDPRHLRAAGSLWERATGLAVDGPHGEATRERDRPNEDDVEDVARFPPRNHGVWESLVSHRPLTGTVTTRPAWSCLASVVSGGDRGRPLDPLSDLVPGHRLPLRSRRDAGVYEVKEVQIRQEPFSG